MIREQILLLKNEEVYNKNPGCQMTLRIFIRVGISARRDPLSDQIRKMLI